MKLEFKKRNTGKTFSAMTELKDILEKGLKCVVLTPNPEKTKKDFECMTGVKLNLDPCEGKKGIYKASLKTPVN